jgi:hypothetical protein
VLSGGAPTHPHTQGWLVAVRRRRLARVCCSHTLSLHTAHQQGAKIGYLPQGDLLSEQQQQPDSGSSNNSSSSSIEDMSVLQAVLASDNEMTRAVQVGWVEGGCGGLQHLGRRLLL